ncbi:hypothetical protein OIU84_006448 [Salix udensis]|uniref:Uncharacterized protein n=1 Tax=Salix udensis TaxID=889485 RepID=A0AAD6JYF5_9ROSI|nr:hypothetical protein OIU84_006448 [Salix udensis]
MSCHLKENSKLGLIITEKIQIMGVSEAGKVCKNHPYLDQKQGVCAACLQGEINATDLFQHFTVSSGCTSFIVFFSRRSLLFCCLFKPRISPPPSPEHFG